MVKIDKLDKKLLCELSKDARQYLTELSKKLHKSREVITYRINKLEKEEVIKGYHALINPTTLGYTAYRVYLKNYSTNQTIHSEMLNYLNNKKYTIWLAELDGIFDLLFAYAAKNWLEFRQFYNEFLTTYRKFILRQIISPTIWINFPAYYLSPSKKKKGLQSIKKEERKIGQGNKVKYDNIDSKILHYLADNARIKNTDISRKLNIDVKTVINRIKKLEKKKAIVGYEADINFSKLGYEWYCVKINLSDYKKKTRILNFLRAQPDVTGISFSLAPYDIEFDLMVKSGQEYFNVINKIKNKFDFITTIDYFRILKTHKRKYTPALLGPD